MSLLALRSQRPQVVRLRDQDLEKFTQTIGAALSDVADHPDRYSDPSSPSTQSLLRRLAQHGAGFYQALASKVANPTELDAIRRLSIATTSDTYFPAEFVYQGEAPSNEAKLCPGYSEALQTGSCCGERGTEIICPLAFWSLSRVVDRHCEVPPEMRLEIDGFVLWESEIDPTDPIRPFRAVAFAASDRAQAFESSSLKDLYTHLEECFGEESRATVSDWDSWVAAVKAKSPSLLLLLPHHERIGGFEYLQLGPMLADSSLCESSKHYLKSVLLRAHHVKAESASPAPVVVLMGCDTQSARVGFESFVSRFRYNGASVVIATMATVLGRHAAPVAKMLVETMKENLDRNATMGDVLLSAKRKLLLRGYPMVLGVTSYGGSERTMVR